MTNCLVSILVLHHLKYFWLFEFLGPVVHELNYWGSKQHKGRHEGRLAQYASYPEHWSIAVGQSILLPSQFGICENKVTNLKKL